LQRSLNTNTNTSTLQEPQPIGVQSSSVVPINTSSLSDQASQTSVCICI
jgi:hypothetical protein